MVPRQFADSEQRLAEKLAQAEWEARQSTVMPLALALIPTQAHLQEEEQGQELRQEPARRLEWH